MSVELKNTYVIRTDDNDFRKELDKFLASHCEKKGKNAAVFDMTEKGAEKVMEVVYEDLDNAPQIERGKQNA